MGRGQPDWGEYAPQEQVSKTLDLAELAARLGSPVVYDRNGTVLFMDTFAYDLIHWLIHTEPECTITVSNTVALFGGKSAKFAFSGISTDSSYITVIPPFRYLDRVGLEVTPSWDNPNIALTLYGFFFYQNISYTFGVRITPALQKVEIRTDAGWITVLDNLSMITGVNIWHFIKLVVSISPAQYVCLKINDQTIDLSAYTLNGYPFNTANRVQFGIYSLNTGNTAGNLYIGSVIGTINEP
jgi:hypothetical protein